MRFFSSLFFALVLLVPSVSAAAEIRGGEILVISEAINDDAYIAGGQVEIQNSINGDAVIAGGELYISGSIEEDLSAAAGRLRSTGIIGDDARIAAGEVRITGAIGDDLFVTGGRIELGEQTSVEGDVRIAGGEVFIDGVIEGDLDIHAGRVVLRGIIQGDVEISAEEITIFAAIEEQSKLIAPKLNLGSSASFSGDVEYWTKNEAIDFTSALNGAGAVYNPDLAPHTKDVARVAGTAAVFAAITGILTSLLFSVAFIVLAILVTKTAFHDAAKRLRDHPWLSGFTGVLYYILTPVILLVLTVTIVGLPLAILGGVLYGFSIYFAVPVSAVVLAHMLEQRLRAKWNVWMQLLASIGVFICLCGLGLFPIVGWLLVAAVVCFCTGSLLHVKWKKLKEIR